MGPGGMETMKIFIFLLIVIGVTVLFVWLVGVPS